MKSKTLPIIFDYKDDLPVGKIEWSVDKALTDDQLSGMILAPAYITLDNGNREVIAFGLISGERYKQNN